MSIALATLLRCVATISTATATLALNAEHLAELDDERFTRLVASTHTLQSLVDREHRRREP